MITLHKSSATPSLKLNHSSTSFPEDATAPPIDQDDSQEDEFINILDDYDDHTSSPSSDLTTSFQEIITKMKEEAIYIWQKTLGELNNNHSFSERNERQVRKDDVAKWEEKLLAEVAKSKKAMKKKQQLRQQQSSSSSLTNTKCLPRDVAHMLQEMEDRAEVEVHSIMTKEEASNSYNNNNNTSSCDKQQQQQQQQQQQLEQDANESPLKYTEMLYQLGILDKQIKDHEAGIQKCTRKLLRSVGVTLEQKSRIKMELHHHKIELAKTESKMIEIKKMVNNQTRSLYLMKFYKELKIQEESVKMKEADVRKWQIILKWAEEGINNIALKGARKGVS